MINKKKAAPRTNRAASDNAFDTDNLKLPCAIEQYKQMRPYPVQGLPGKCLGHQCDAFNQVNPDWGYCIFHAGIRAMVHDAKRGNVEVARILERMGITL